MKRLLDHDAETGMTIWHDYDDETGVTRLRYEQDVEDILNRNKRLANEAAGRMGEMIHVAAIPLVVQMKWLIEKGVDVHNPDHKKAVAKLLDDPDWRYLKTRNIILGTH